MIMRIYAFHLLNDYSGSPKVLMQLLKAWINGGMGVNIVTCSGRDGFLSNIEGAAYHPFWYRWSANPLLRFINLFLAQVVIFMRLLNVVQKSDVIYINTVLPFGAALLGKVKGCRIIYHIHETSIKPAIFKRFLFAVIKCTADDVVYVSKYLARLEAITTCRTHILYNSIENEFLEKAKQNRTFSDDPENILMVCSLKAYKGVNEFVDLSRRLRNYKFRLVLNASEQDIEKYFSGIDMPVNLVVYSTQTDLHPFYRWADILLNLSRPDGWIETFGLTVIEGMAYGLPAIVPPVGGITELIDPGNNGYYADSRKIDKIGSTIHFILENTRGYTNMHTYALKKIEFFREDQFAYKSLMILRHEQAEIRKLRKIIPEYGMTGSNYFYK